MQSMMGFLRPGQGGAGADGATAQQAEVINGAATLFAEAFRFGGALGVKRALGTEHSHDVAHFAMACGPSHSSAEHLIATKALRCTATAWIPHCR